MMLGLTATCGLLKGVWIPTFVGMTSERAVRSCPKNVIPAQAGIQKLCLKL
jgi:hypothetical protein